MRGIRKDVRDLKEKLKPTPIITPKMPDIDWEEMFERYGDVLLKTYYRELARLELEREEPEDRYYPESQPDD